MRSSNGFGIRVPVAFASVAGRSLAHAGEILKKIVSRAVFRRPDWHRPRSQHRSLRQSIVSARTAWASHFGQRPRPPLAGRSPMRHQLLLQRHRRSSSPRSAQQRETHRHGLNCHPADRVAGLWNGRLRSCQVVNVKVKQGEVEGYDLQILSGLVS